MSAYIAPIGLPVNTGQVDPHYSGRGDYWTVKCRDANGVVYLEFVHRGQTSVREELEARGITFDDKIEVDFHRG